MSESIRQLKAQYRKKVKEIINALSIEDVEKQSSMITKRALELAEYKNARSISIFLSMPGKEISTRDIVLRAFEDGKTVFVPYIHPGKEPKSKVMDMLRLKDKSDLDSLQPDSWGIPSLSADSVQMRENALGGIGCEEDPNDFIADAPMLDLMFMPAVAFDKTQHRLGHGKGFYDRYLSEYKNHPLVLQQRYRVPFLVGLALREQMLSIEQELPTTEHDWKVDRVVTSDD